MFKIAKITPFITSNTIFFQITIPLLRSDKFQIFKIFQIPFMKNSHSVNIKTQNEFIMTSIDRQVYQFLSLAQLKSCDKIAEKGVICYHPRHWHTHSHSTCEWNLLTHQSNNNCVTMLASEVESWQELEEPNKWLFHVPLATTLTVICGDTVSHDDVSGSGLLELNQNCSIRDNDKIIEPHVDLEDNSNEFIFPRLTNETLKLMTHERPHLGELNYYRSNFSKIEEQLNELQRDAIETKTINGHDVHHYFLIYVLLIAVCLLAAFVWWFGKTATKQGLTNLPIPAPRRFTVSMPNIDHL